MTQLPAAALTYLLTALGIYMVSDGTPSQKHDVTAVTVAHCTGDERKQVPDGLQDQGRPGGGNKGVLHQDKAGAKSLMHLPSETCRRFAMISCLPISKLVSPCFKSRPLPRFRCARQPLQARPLSAAVSAARLCRLLPAVALARAASLPRVPRHTCLLNSPARVGRSRRLLKPCIVIEP